MTTSRKTLFGKLGETLFRSIESATTFCKLRGNPYVELAHWLHQILALPDSDMHRICRHGGVDREKLDADLVRALAALPAGASSISDFSNHIDIAIERAWVAATLEFRDPRVRGAWLMAALLKSPELRRVLLSISPEFAKIGVTDLNAMLPAWIIDSPEEGDQAYESADFPAVMPGVASGAMGDAAVAGSAWT